MTDTNWPKQVHPAHFDEQRHEFIVDLERVYEIYQLNPLNWWDCAMWIGGEIVTDDHGNQAVRYNGKELALGDIAVSKGNGIHFESADGFYQRYILVDEMADFAQ